MLQTSPPQIATLSKAIKVTVDGPREPRSKTRHPAFHPFHFGPRPFPFGHPQDPLGFKLSGLQQLGLNQGITTTQGWGGLPRNNLPPHCVQPPLHRHSHAHLPLSVADGTVAASAVVASAFNSFHHVIDQRSPRLSASTNDSPIVELGPICVSVRNMVPTTSIGSIDPGLLTTAATVTASISVTTDSVMTMTTSSNSNPSSHHQDSEGVHLLGATNSLFGSIFAPLLPTSSWLYNPLYHTQQYILEPEWHTLALRMAQQRLQKADQSRVEDFQKLQSDSNSSEDMSKEKEEAFRDVDSSDGSIEVDDSDSFRPKSEQHSQSEESLEQISPKLSPIRNVMEFQEETSVRLRRNLENFNEYDHVSQLVKQDQCNQCDVSVKIRLEGTVDLTTKSRIYHKDKENVGQDLTTNRGKEEKLEMAERESSRPRREKSPKARQVWRPY